MAMRLDAILNLQTGGFTGPLQGAMGGLGGLVGKLAGLAAGALSVAAVIGGLKSALDMGGALTDMSAQTGVTVRDLVVLKQAFQDAGLSGESVAPSINIMQKALTGVSESGEPTNKMFERLGLNMEQLRGLSAMDQFKAIGGSIGKLGSDAERTGAAMAIFGRSGAGLKALFADPEAIEKTAAALGSMPEVMARNAASFDMIGDMIGQIKTKTVGLWAGVLEGMAPALASMTEALNGIDLAGLGVKIGNVIGILIEAFKSGQIGELLWLGLKIGLGTAINYIVGTLGNGGFWKGIAMIIAGSLVGLGAMILKIFLTPLSYIQAGFDKMFAEVFEGLAKRFPKLASFMGIGDVKAKSYTEYVADNQNSSYLKDASTASMGMAGELLAGGGKAIAESIQNGNLVNVDAMKGEFGDLVAGLQDKVDASKAKLAEKAGGAAPLPGVAAALAAPTKDLKAAKEASVDRFAKIGWFVGAGGNNASINYSRRTAGNTDRMVALLGKIASGIGKTGDGQFAMVSA